VRLNGLSRCDEQCADRAKSGDGLHRQPDLITHLAVALSRYTRELRRSGLPVPQEIEELSGALRQSVMSRQGSSFVGTLTRSSDHASVPDRLLLTKPEAAERLGVSIRTVERLVASGRLPQLHVGRAARLRVSDLEAYVQSAECGVGEVMNRSSR
jgi:excisionase family DNA binding protein